MVLVCCTYVNIEAPKLVKKLTQKFNLNGMYPLFVSNSVKFLKLFCWSSFARRYSSRKIIVFGHGLAMSAAMLFAAAACIASFCNDPTLQ